jgi:hypothetical protein
MKSLPVSFYLIRKKMFVLFLITVIIIIIVDYNKLYLVAGLMMP